ncbi:ADP-heptose:LPS heptosyltransferase [Edaphobacter aggregans]|uniref:ADP-heptose:LPS heptosyltransferase n=1 Tax=Edaphobacter aggregans TaxID=570835 RepID=A0A3R9R057_9BACT|nr:glycosyltransferase family 9 protein [Edaphobacter aggregans]RSL14793.1 ADP-heptose:LPS heptosyltransferase [Edaphobacter aggregans]
MALVQTVKGSIFSSVAAAERLVSNGIAATPLHQIKHFLLLQYPRALGTAIHATPLIPALRHAVPDSRIVVASSGFATEVFRNNPGVDHLFATPSPLDDLKSAVQSLRQQNPFKAIPYAVITSTGNERTRVTAQALLSGSPLRVGFTLAPQLYRVPLSFDPTLSQIANNLRIIESLGHPSQHFEPQVFFTAEDLAGAQQTLADAGVQPGQPVAAFITQTSVTQRKSWRSERFRAAATFLAEHYGAHILFIGTAAESPAIDELRNPLPFPTISVAGKTKLPQLAALLSLCRVGLTLDTGPMHIGRAVGLPMVIIAPAWSPPIEWLPVGDTRFRILKNADMPTATPDYIIDEVTIDDVKAALTSLLAQ